MSVKPYGVNELREMFLSFFETKKNTGSQARGDR